MQRNAMLMYTSCGWFFDEICGLEPVQILKYAAIVIQYLRDLGGPDLAPELERRLAAAPSNVADSPTAARSIDGWSTPLDHRPRRVAAHYAITGLFTEYPDQAAIYALPRRAAGRDASNRQRHRPAGRLTSGSSRRSPGRPATSCTRCCTSAATTSPARCAPGKAEAPYDGMKNDLLARYARYSLADMVRGIDEHFPGETFGLPHLFLDERRRARARHRLGTGPGPEETYRGSGRRTGG